jgi:hypothetical protein
VVGYSSFGHFMEELEVIQILNDGPQADLCFQNGGLFIIDNTIER